MDRLSCFDSFFLSLHHKSKALVHFVGSGSREPGSASGKLISLPGMNAGATTVHRSSITPLLSFSHVVSLVREFSLFLFPVHISRIFTSHESVWIFFFFHHNFCFPPHFKNSEILQHISTQKHICGHYSLFSSPFETVMSQKWGSVLLHGGREGVNPSTPSPAAVVTSSQHWWSPSVRSTERTPQSFRAVAGSIWPPRQHL